MNRAMGGDSKETKKTRQVFSFVYGPDRKISAPETFWYRRTVSTKAMTSPFRPHFQAAITRTKITRDSDGKWTVAILHPQSKITAQATAAVMADARDKARTLLEEKLIEWQRS